MIILHRQAPVDPTEYLYTLPGCALGYHYKAFQRLNLIYNALTEVSPEVLALITKGPLLCCVVFRRVHSFIHSFPTRWIPRASLNLHHRLVAKLASTTYYAR
jgi:hypothetical protein